MAAQSVPRVLLDGKDPSKVALYFLDFDCTYAYLQRSAANVAGYLIGNGARKGERVILLADNSEFWVAAYLGAMAAGLVCVPLPSTISEDDLAYVKDVVEAKISFMQSRFARRRKDGGLRGAEIVTEEHLRSMPDTGSHAPELFGDAEPLSGGDDLAAIMFTSGSTGKPRGVMISHANILANTKSIVASLSLTADDRIMAVLPFHYCFGTSLLHTHLFVGGSLVVDPRFMYPETVLHRMAVTECTGFAGVPSHFQILLRNSSLRRRTFPRLRYVQQAGGCLAPAFIRDLRSALPGTDIYVMYGQTEATARLSCLPANLLDAKLGSVGRGIPGVTLRVLNEAGEDVRPGEVGEIVATGPNIAQGYWKTPEETAATFRDGVLQTGDLATVDEDGFIYIVDRAKDFLKCGGRRISCRQLEEQMLEYRELIEVAIVAVPDEVLGEAPRAFVVPRGADWSGIREDLLRFCRERMPPQLVPKEIVPLKSLPKNSAGKVLKTALKSSPLACPGEADHGA